MTPPLAADAFGVDPVLPGPLVTLRPLGLRYLDDYLVMLSDPEGARLTGTTTSFDRRTITEWLTSRPDQHDRADWAIVSTENDALLGEVVLNQFEPDEHRIHLEVVDFNPRARRSYTKAGFREEGVLREAHHDENGWHNIIVMAALASDRRP